VFFFIAEFWIDNSLWSVWFLCLADFSIIRPSQFTYPQVVCNNCTCVFCCWVFSMPLYFAISISLHYNCLAAASLSRSQSDVSRTASPSFGDRIEDKPVIWRGLLFYYSIYDWLYWMQFERKNKWNDNVMWSVLLIFNLSCAFVVLVLINFFYYFHGLCRLFLI
jgi:hypothetical protein